MSVNFNQIQSIATHFQSNVLVPRTFSFHSCQFPSFSFILVCQRGHLPLWTPPPCSFLARLSSGGPHRPAGLIVLRRFVPHLLSPFLLFFMSVTEGASPPLTPPLTHSSWVVLRRQLIGRWGLWAAPISFYLTECVRGNLGSPRTPS